MSFNHEKLIIQIGPLTEVLAREVCTWHYEGVYSVYDFSDWDVVVQNCWSLADEEVRTNDFLALYLDDIMVGFGRIQLQNDEVALGIGLKPEYCGKGYGQACMSALVSEAQNRFGREVAIGLEVRRFNKRAIKCYEKVGFLEERNYMKDTLHGFIAYIYMRYKGAEDGPLLAE